MVFVKESAATYVCSDEEWVLLAGQENITFSCESKVLKDSSGYAIICNGDTIGTVYNGKDGVAGVYPVPVG
ncbi:MAG: hypothetical protein J6Z31_08095 [Fibrobacter sp.]|nr:hypothetical protein [Fibrobacter sp.]